MFKLKWILSIVLGIYIFGFFLLAPIQMIGISSGWYKITVVAQKIDAFAYRPWIMGLGPENPVLNLRAENYVFWCGLFENCQAEY